MMNDSQDYSKVENLGNGIGYCLIMNTIFPKCLSVSRIRIPATTEVDCLFNLKLLQGAFCQCKVDRDVPIDLISKRKFQDNYEFALWFKKFADANYSEQVSNGNVMEIKKPSSKLPSTPGSHKFSFKQVLSETKSNKSGMAKPLFRAAANFNESENLNPNSSILNSATKLKISIDDLKVENLSLKSENESLKSSISDLESQLASQNQQHDKYKEAINDIILAIKDCPEEFLPCSFISDIINEHDVVELDASS